MKLAFAYERVAPECLGGAERYYAALCRRLALEHDVHYLTSRHWDGPRTVVRDGVELIGLVQPQRHGRFLPKLRFAFALAGHLARRGGGYDVVHVCCFPHVAVLAAWLGLLVHPRTRLVVDWFEVLPLATWLERLGRVGRLGWLVQRAALGVGDAALTFSRLHERRLREEGCRAPVTVVPAFHPDLDRAERAARATQREHLIVFAGRLVSEKHADLVPAVVAALRRSDSSWRGLIFGSGPDEDSVRDAIERHEVSDVVRLAGFVPWEEVAEAFGRAAALVFPTVREGFGLVVLEAAQQGLPTVLVRAPGNAAVELVAPGRNGYVVDAPDPELLAAAVLDLASDAEIHESTLAWYAEASRRLNVDATAAALARLYAAMS